ncbi:uncharacterized protein RCC_10509 [Ramularia collo-cygni]|uniref:Uncharacterized protein n=1 Tax=Ramularia collo-cygni TaxID=112498 RepID=A0A2D3VK02_9PEZI|nr:uncharacterized protein RCC_10509 [Ramularia collo-cygni]CZT24781.1 uncharacterized protein RCC_10509 [Ramularia collo-cygni]
MIGPTRLSADDYSRQLHSSTVNQCGSKQLNKGYKRPVCCKAGFKPSGSAPGYTGMNCIDGLVDGGSRWSFKPKYDSTVKSKYSGVSKRSSSTIQKRGPLASAVESIPIADNEAMIFALSPEPEFPEHLEGSPSSALAPAELNHILSEMDVATSRRSVRKRSSGIYPDTEPSGSGHQTQDAVLRDLLASNIIQRASRAKAFGSAGVVTKRSLARGRREPKDMTASST